jgi:hypothetical protein
MDGGGALFDQMQKEKNMEAKEKLRRPYEVGTGNGTIDLTVRIGEGCHGPISIFIHGTEIKSGAEEVTASLGTADNLKGKTVAVFATSNQLNDSRVASITYHFSGGPAPSDYTNPSDQGSQPFGVDKLIQFEDMFDMVPHENLPL